MVDLTSLHPLDPEIVARYVGAVMREAEPAIVTPWSVAWGERLVVDARLGLARAAAGNEAGANAVSYGLARALATAHPTYLLAGASLTTWEARIDRGLGMLLRPPSRLFGDAGMPTPVARAMPIRLDRGGAQMGGAHVPARLIPELRRLLETRSERLVRRLIEAERDGVAIVGLMMEAVAYVEERGLGIYEAVGVVTPDAPEGSPPGALVIVPDRARLEPVLRRRLEEAAKPPKPPKPPSLAARLLGRRGRSTEPPSSLA
jgi:hypothetical protein